VFENEETLVKVMLENITLTFSFLGRIYPFHYKF